MIITLMMMMVGLRCRIGVNVAMIDNFGNE